MEYFILRVLIEFTDQTSRFGSMLKLIAMFMVQLSQAMCELALPKELSVADLLALEADVAAIQQFRQGVLLKLNPASTAFASVEQQSDHSPAFIRKVLTIKINSMLKHKSPVAATVLQNLLDHLKNPPQVKLSNSEADFYRRLLTGSIISEVDRFELSGGCSLQLAILHQAICASQQLIKNSEVTFAVSFEVLNGRINAFLDCVNVEKNHKGQIECAKNIRALLTTGQFETSAMNQTRTKFHKRVQDCYSLRCVPQVHGVSYDFLDDTIRGFLQQVDMPQTAHILLNGKTYPVQPPNQKLTQLLDCLALSINQLASISIVRSQRMLNDHLNKLPIPMRQMPSYAMLDALYWQCSALFLKSKAQMVPLSSDSLNGSNYKIDISYSMHNALSLTNGVWRNADIVLGLELLIAVRCLEELWKKTTQDRLTPQLEHHVKLVESALTGEYDGIHEFEQALRAYRRIAL